MMGKRVAVLTVLVILAGSLSLQSLAADETPGAGTAPEGLSGAATLSGGAPGDAYPEGLIHTVVKGDTLWDLSARYLGSPWRWPELWERNRFLTNPHYIYPGIQVVVFSPPAREYVMEVRQPEQAAEEAGTKAAAEPGKEGAPEAPGAVHAGERVVSVVPELEVVRAGYFLPTRPAGIGNIQGGADARVAFSERDKVFLSLSKEIPAGQLLGVYRVRGPVDSPPGSSVSGYVKYLIGILQVAEPEDGKATAVVRTSFEDLSRADQIDEEIPGYAPIVLKPGGGDLEAVVLTGRGDHTEFAPGQVIYLDKGSEAGVEVGNLFRVFDGQDGATWSENRSGGETAPVEVARAVIVRTLPGTSSAYIFRGTRSFPAGVTSRRGGGPGEDSTGAH